MSIIFQTEEPTNTELKKYISHYYFHSSSDVDNKVSFSFYPHFKNAITLYKDAHIEKLAPTFTKITASKGSFVSAYSQVYKRFAKSEIHGAFQKIGIVFQPLGLNHFIDGSLSEIIKYEINIDFNYFSKELDPILPALFDADAIGKTEILDAFFIRRLKGFSELRMTKVVELILDELNDYSVQDLADELNVSRKTLLRLFRKHLGCSVQDYLALIQFRKAIDTYQKAGEKPSFTGLALDLNYYDQSDFIRHFRRITNMNPKKFFENLKEFGKHDTFWSPD